MQVSEQNLFSTEAYDYSLPEELIAQNPSARRENARLMVIDRQTGEIDTSYHIGDFPELLSSGDQLIVNNTKVIPARLFGRRQSGGAVELLLLRKVTADIWQTLIKPGKKSPLGSTIYFEKGLQAEVIGVAEKGIRIIRFTGVENSDEAIQQLGVMPLPPYIQREAYEQDSQRYQTVFASQEGAVAAPTAGLHFSTSLLRKLQEMGVSRHEVTLHTGLGTFRPVECEDVRKHDIHTEKIILSDETAARLNSSSVDTQQVVVGTTCCRLLESFADENGILVPGDKDTNIFIYPGYRFRATRTLLTNFHLPRSTLMMLVSAFGGYELIREAYARAVSERFRFYSYGDAMWIRS